MNKKMLFEICLALIVVLLFSFVFFIPKVEAKDINDYYNRMVEVYKKEDWKNLDQLSEYVLKNFTPKPYFAFYFKGFALGQLGDFDGSIISFSSAIKRRPDEYYLYEFRGMAYFRNKQYDKAIADFDKAMELVPDEKGKEAFKTQKEIIMYAKKGIAVTKNGNLKNYQSMKDPAYLIEEYRNLSDFKKQKYINDVKNYSDTVLPIYYIAVADDVYKQNKNLAALLFTIGRYRITQDALSCKDSSATGIIGMLNFYAMDTASYIGKMGKKKRIKLLQQVLDWDEQHPNRPNPKWVCYHGIDVFINNDEQPKIVSSKKYKEIRQKVRETLTEVINEAGK